MFPQDNISVDVSVDTSISAEIKRSFSFDFGAKQFILVDGKIKEIANVEAVRQWIKLFLSKRQIIST